MSVIAYCGCTNAHKSNPLRAHWALEPSPAAAYQDKLYGKGFRLFAGCKEGGKLRRCTVCGVQKEVVPKISKEAA